MEMSAGQWGRSVGIRLPSNFTREHHIQNGTKLEYTFVKGGILIKPKKYDAKMMLSEITDDLMDDLFPDDEFVGNEIW